MRRGTVFGAYFQIKQEQLTVLDALSLPEPKTREIVRLMDNLQAQEKGLLVTAEPDVNVYRSSRNIPGVKSVLARQINVLDIMSYDRDPDKGCCCCS